jgi:hypothetical protein
VPSPLKLAGVTGIFLVVLKFGLQLFDASKEAYHILFVRNPLL